MTHDETCIFYDEMILRVIEFLTNCAHIQHIDNDATQSRDTFD